MAGLYKLTYKHSGKEDHYSGAGGFDFYVLPSGPRVPVEWRLVWCAGCCRVTWAELIHSMENIQRRIKTWEDPESANLQPELKGYKHEDEKQWYINTELSSLRLYRDVLLVRSEPAHCMKCGGIDHVPIPYNEEFLLPDGSDTVELSWTGFAQTIGLSKYFDPDGHPMPEGYTFDYANEGEWEPCPHHNDRDWRYYASVVTFPLWILPALLLFVGMEVWDRWEAFRARDRMRKREKMTRPED